MDLKKNYVLTMTREEILVLKKILGGQSEDMLKSYDLAFEKKEEDNFEMLKSELSELKNYDLGKKKKVPLYKKGEVVQVKEGKFRILKLTPIGMILKGVPETTPLG